MRLCFSEWEERMTDDRKGILTYFIFHNYQCSCAIRFFKFIWTHRWSWWHHFCLWILVALLRVDRFPTTALLLYIRLIFINQSTYVFLLIFALSPPHVTFLIFLFMNSICLNYLCSGQIIFIYWNDQHIKIEYALFMIQFKPISALHIHIKYRTSSVYQSHEDA